jgi:hypothetical protein
MQLKTEQTLNGPMKNLLSSEASVIDELNLKLIQPKGLTMFSKALMLLLCLSTSSFAFAAKSDGAGSGGGGDASEIRVNEIRSDILKWIHDGGAKGLTLPSTLSYDEYISQMDDILQSKKVVIGFVEKDDENNDELKVVVNGAPKTCRGFVSLSDSRPHILCNISRFKATSEADQYELIHHEFAGLVNVENNEGAASDYGLSSQITGFLSREIILKIAVKKSTYADTNPKDYLDMNLLKALNNLQASREISILNQNNSNIKQQIAKEQKACLMIGYVYGIASSNKIKIEDKQLTEILNPAMFYCGKEIFANSNKYQETNINQAVSATLKAVIGLISR